MSIASKEARETHYWLELLNQSRLTTFDVKQLQQDSIEIIHILTSIVKTSQNKGNIKN